MAHIHGPHIELLDDAFISQYGLKLYLHHLLSTYDFRTFPSSEPPTPSIPSIPIGSGQCGIIYALPNTPTNVVKVAKPHKLAALEQDRKTHERVIEIFDALDPALKARIGGNIPRYVNWIEPNDWAWWGAQGVGREETDTHVAVASSSLVSTRIPALSDPARESLFAYFAPPSLRSDSARSAALAEEKNKDVLVRVYLGRRQVRSEKAANFKLRNFELYVNEMEELGLDTAMYARVMARTLAVLHWGVGTDGNDIEFVLGGVPRAENMQRVEQGDGLAPVERTMGPWLLDFNQCSFFQHDQAGLKMLVDAFWWNDPYYPRPCSRDVKDRALWRVFREAYLEMSGEVREVNLAREFVEAVEGRRAGVASLFG